MSLTISLICGLHQGPDVNTLEYSSTLSCSHGRYVNTDTFITIQQYDEGRKWRPSKQGGNFL
ncbi:hypothetical protein A6R68_12941 [Neotoma lepida]|uniref:Uncharacterized protein n=1 Tax=Neotoma lepida TaxID=56216 RepID=A0A1A6H4F5_NEOLE|nr:hypothetical protein A6R68_12941 [Neotoma lepida]